MKNILLIRSAWLGKTFLVLSSDDESRDEFFSAKILIDLSISYTPKTWLTITAGANNVFDVYPDRVKNSIKTNQEILIYSCEYGVSFSVIKTAPHHKVSIII